MNTSHSLSRETDATPRKKTGPKPRPISDRFWEKVIPEPNSGCWLWEGTCSKGGYGRISSETPSKTGAYVGRPAHRVSYELHKGPIPHGAVIDHLCRNPSCVNPDHLEAVSHQENLRRGIFLNRRRGKNSPNGAKTHCKRGHPLDGANLYIAPSTGTRSCLICRKEASRRSKAKRR